MAVNQRLLDIMTRHQVYLEQVKLYQAQQFNQVLLNLQAELSRQFALLDYNDLDDLTKAKLYMFIQAIKASQFKIYNAYTSNILTMISDFSEVDTKLTKNILQNVYINKSTPFPDDDEDYADIDTPVDSLTPQQKDDRRKFLLIPFPINKTIKSTYTNAVLPANGIPPVSFLNAFAATASNSVVNLINQGYSNNWSKQETLDNIIGTASANFKDGAFNKIYNQNSAVLNTILQHVSSIAQTSVASQIYEQYMWVSVLDNRTTEICRSRDGNIYKYGDGPLPPAHINCRSKTVPYIEDGGDSDYEATYYGWLQNQPTAVQNDILGINKAGGLRNGSVNSTDIDKFTNNKTLTMEQFANKIGLILS